MTLSHTHSLTRRPSENLRGDVSVGVEGNLSYRALLALAHNDGLRSIRTTLLQLPTLQNRETAIVQAVVATKRGIFMGLADANPANANALVAAHLVALAETRAEARALRKAVNAGVVAQDAPNQALATHLNHAVQAGEARGPSDAQRRYLFQLLAAEGLKGALARDFVHHELGVTSLGAATRSSIYTLIDRLRRSRSANDTHASDRRAS